MKVSTHAKDMYTQRLHNLQALGFPSYKAYLRSTLWAQIKARLLPPETPCYACGKRATTLHHNRYDVDDLTGFCTTHLIPVCQGCHSTAEFNTHGNKIGPHQATGKLAQLREHHAVRRQQRDTWHFVFETLRHARVYLGMQPEPEAQQLAADLDMALNLVQALPRKQR